MSSAITTHCGQAVLPVGCCAAAVHSSMINKLIIEGNQAINSETIKSVENHIIWSPLKLTFKQDLLGDEVVDVTWTATQKQRLIELNADETLHDCVFPDTVAREKIQAVGAGTGENKQGAVAGLEKYYLSTTALSVGKQVG